MENTHQPQSRLLDHPSIHASLRDGIIVAIRRNNYRKAEDLAHAIAVELRKSEIAADVLDVLADAKQSSAPPPKKPDYALLTVSDLRAQPVPRWLVADLIPDRGLCILYGEPGCGKSFFALDLSMHLALGRRWADRRIRRATVLYAALEGHLLSRIEALQTDRSLVDADLQNFLAIQTDKLDLLDLSTSKKLIKQIRDHFGDHRPHPLVIVIDTLARSMPGGNENASEDMGAIIESCSMLERNLDALIVLVHHSGKDAQRGARGWSGLKAAADVEIMIERDANTRRAMFTKVKEGHDGAAIEFELRVVDLGPRSDHDPDASPYERRTSCVVDITRTDVQPDTEARRKAIKGKNQILLLNALRHEPDGKMSKQSAMEFLAKAGINKSSRYAAVDALAVAQLIKLVGDDIQLVNK